MSNKYSIKHSTSHIVIDDSTVKKLSEAKKARNGKMFLLDEKKLKKWL